MLADWRSKSGTKRRPDVYYSQVRFLQDFPELPADQFQQLIVAPEMALEIKETYDPTRPEEVRTRSMQLRRS
jgi:hypothetical protein